LGTQPKRKKFPKLGRVIPSIVQGEHLEKGDEHKLPTTQ
jgi:hypothetical protein